MHRSRVWGTQAFRVQPLQTTFRAMIHGSCKSSTSTMIKTPRKSGQSLMVFTTQSRQVPCVSPRSSCNSSLGKKTLCIFRSTYMIGYYFRDRCLMVVILWIRIMLMGAGGLWLVCIGMTCAMLAAVVETISTGPELSCPSRLWDALGVSSIVVAVAYW